MNIAEARCRTSLFILACLLIGCSPRDPEEGRRLIVYVVGDGVPPIRRDIKRHFPLNRAQGQAMWEGADAALRFSRRLEGVKDIILLKGFDDGGLAEEARRFGERIQKEEDVLAVIGHATSETTQAAAGSYDNAGIPLLMPIATSDRVMFYQKRSGKRSVRVRTAFRLPPSDGLAQAPAIAYLAKALNLKKIALLQDTSEGARGYSDPLMATISPLLKQFTVEAMSVSRGEKQSFYDAANVVRANGSDSVVFVGYGSTAQELVHALRSVYSGIDVQSRPRLIFTDGCLIPDLNLDGFLSFLTFPHIELRQPESDLEAEDIKLVKSLVNQDLTLSYEPFGYDAMLILGQAVQLCLDEGKVSRTCVRRMLSSSGPFFGTTGIFDFNNGENRYSSYDVFETRPGQLKLSRREVVPAETLARFRSPL